MKKLIIFMLFIFCLGLTPTARSQGTFTAASCSQSDVNAVINGPTHNAVNGDTINIPAGTCTWTSGIAVRAGIGIAIIGAGQGVTTITDQLSSGSLFSMRPTFGNATSRISSMTLLPHLPRSGYDSPISVTGTCTSGGCPNLRMDHLTTPSGWAGTGISDDTFAIVANMFGVADHNTVGGGAGGGNGVDFINVSHGSWQGVGAWGDNSWASPDTFGTAQSFYLENNTFVSGAFGTDTDTGGPAGGGARLVCRFNTFNNITSAGACSGHGTDTTGRARGVRQWEGYYNTGTCSSTTTGCGSAWPGRSGVGMSFENSFTNVGGGFMKGLTDLDAQRRWRPDVPWGACSGTSPWDENDGATYYSGTIASVSTTGNNNYVITDSGSSGMSQWGEGGSSPYSFVDVTRSFGYEIAAGTSNSIETSFTGSNFGVNVPTPGDSYQIKRSTACMDQPARGAGALVREAGTGLNPVLASTGAPGSVNQALDPTYQAADSLPGTADHTISSDTASIVPNRDFFAESVHQAAQTSPTSPFNGTSGTGHGTLANRPTTCTLGVGYWATDQGNWNQSGSGGQGELFVCTAPNDWTLYYTPYTYPHPLITGGSTGTGGNSPNPPTGLSVTVK